MSISYQQWQQHIDAWQQTKLTQAQYCRSHQIDHNNGQDEPGVAVEYQPSHPKDLNRFARNINFFVNSCFGGA